MHELRTRNILSGKEKVIYQMKNIRLLPLEVHFGVRGCGRTDSAGGGLVAGGNKVKGGVCSRPPPLKRLFSIGTPDILNITSK